ncbi:MAG: VWA domain-containing protein [Candidatus Altiarchaeota archaeon]
MNVTTVLTGAMSMAGRVSSVIPSEYGFKNPIYLLFSLPFILFVLMYVRKGGVSRRHIAFMAVRVLVIMLVAIAIASPVEYSSRTEVKEFSPIVVVSDVSGSMSLSNGSRDVSTMVFNDIRGLVGNITGKTDNILIDFFGDGNSTGIGDALNRNLVQSEGSSTIMVLVSDGRNNIGRNPVDVAKAVAEANSTIYVVKPHKTGDDVSIQYVLGDRKIPSNTEYEILIGVGNTGFASISYDLEVSVDNVRKFNKHLTQTEFEKQVQLQLRFENPGVYQIRVDLRPESDTIPENNVYYKTVEVVEKPSILVITSNVTSPLTNVLSRLYNVDIKSQVNVDYKPYSAVFLDNIHADNLNRDRVNKLREYVLQGNGLVVVGGKNSYEYGKYNNSFIENLLPVKSTEKPEERRKRIAVLFLIDISQSTEYGMGEDSKIDVEKALALNMLRNLDNNDTVGVIAFNTVPYVVSGMSPLGPKRAEVEDSLLRLRFVGGTDMVPALESAIRTLDGYTIPKYVILLSDGVIPRSKAPIVFSKVTALKDMDVTIYSVGVGFDTDVQLMSEIARTGGGIYFQPEDYQRLKIEFGDKLEEDNPERVPIIVRDQHHFITRSITGWNDERPPSRGYNQVYEKSVAQVPFSTKGGSPALAVWRFGLGRVASLLIDNGLVWGRDVYAAKNGKMVSAMTNWAIGDLEKTKKVRITTSDISIGETASLDVRSSNKPDILLQGGVIGGAPKISVTRTNVETYTAVFTPETVGFYGVKASSTDGQDLDAVAVNYPQEYASLGVDDAVLERMAYVTNGRVYDSTQMSQLEDDLIKHATMEATQEIIDERELWQYFAAIALIIYFIDVVVRRIVEIVLLSRAPRE